MERSPCTISDRKFTRLSVRRQHALLAELAEQYGGVVAGLDLFLARYDHLHRHAELDRFRPPHWLTEAEALADFQQFHAERACLSPGQPASDSAISWQATFAVEVVLDQVRSPYNVGATLRLIDNYGFERLVHATDSLRNDHPQLVRAARGCQHWIPIHKVGDLPTWLAARDRPVIGLEADPQAQPLEHWQPPLQATLVLGNEAYGLAHAVREVCSQLVQVPLFGYKKSMNVTHAFAVVSQRIVEMGACTGK